MNPDIIIVNKEENPKQIILDLKEIVPTFVTFSIKIENNSHHSLIFLIYFQ